MNDKTQFTIEHAQALYQTLADIYGEKYNVTITAKVTKKENENKQELNNK